MALAKQTAHIPLAYGLQTKVDSRALQLPALSICQNVQFDEEGGLQTRRPYAAMPVAALGGGTVGGMRRLVVDGDELILFTQDELFVWSERDQQWITKGAASHPAPVIREDAAFVTTEEQRAADRAELAGTVIRVWVQVGASSEVKVAAADATTGAVIMNPKSLGAGTTRPRLLALATRVLLVFETSTGDLAAMSIDPANVFATTTSATILVGAATYNLRYDMCRSTVTPANALLVYRRDTTTSYAVLRIPEGITGFSSTTKAREADRAVAIASAPSGDRMAVIRTTAAGSVRADILVESTFGDSTVDQVVGTLGADTLRNITAEFQSVATAGTFRCYAVWSVAENTTALNYTTRIGFITSAGAPTVIGQMILNVAPVARAFDYLGRVYFWLAFAKDNNLTAQTPGFRAQLQNTHFLVRDDGMVVAKAAMGRAGGHATIEGRLPGVQALGGNRFVFGGEQRRVIRLDGKHAGYDARSLIDIEAEFDADEARRAVRLGETLYVAGGQILQYDGSGLVEVGFHYFPYRLEAANGGAGPVEAGTYIYKSTWRWDNGRGERERSTTATTEEITLAGASDVSLSPTPFEVTRKVGTTADLFTNNRSAVVIEHWRTKKNPPEGAPFFLITSNDPSVLTGDNRYLPNEPGTAPALFTDALTDAGLATREANPENGAVLENLAPPPATIIAATQDRILLSGIAGNPHQVWYSKLRGAGEIAAFHDALLFDLPPDGGAITALAFLSETLVVFKETAIYSVPGDGFDNTQGGQNYGPARLLSADVGAVSQDAVAFTPRGLMFKSRKGWYLLTGWQPPTYIGGAVAAFDDDEVKAVNVLESQHHVRVLTPSRMLVWDYEVNAEQGGAWSEWTIEGGRSAVVWRGQHLIIAETAIGTGDVRVLAQSDFGDPDVVETVGMDIETAWIKLAELQGFARIWFLMVLGEYRSAHRLRIRLKRDYNETVFQDKLWVVTPTITGGPEQVRHSPSIQQCQAMKVRITAQDAALSGFPTGEALKLTGLSVEYGINQGLFRRLGAAQSQ